MGFWSGIFKGQKKERRQDDSAEYAQFLVKELEELKAETNKALEKEKQSLKEMQDKFLTEKKAKEELEKQVKLFFDKDKTSDTGHLEEKLKNYEKSYEAMTRVLAAAQKESEKMLEDAREEAADIRRQAKVEAQVYQRKLREEARESLEEDRQHFLAAKKQLVECLNALNNSQVRLMEAYEEMGRLMKELPLQIGEMFPGETFSFLLDDGKIPESEETVIFHTEE